MIKTFMITILLGLAYCGRLENSYIPPNLISSQAKSAASLFTRQGASIDSSYLPPFQRSSPSNHFSRLAIDNSARLISSSLSPGPQSSLNRPISKLVAQNSGRLDNSYLPPSQRSSLSNRASQIPILKFISENDGDGSYRFNYETAGGINAEEQGNAGGDGTRAQGSFSYTSNDGQGFSVSYTADENGFVPQGSHLPTSSPIPEAILKSIAINAAARAGAGSYSSSVSDGGYRY